MFKSKLSKVIVLLLRRVLGVTRSGAKRLMRAMLRSLMAMGRRANLPVAGFVLPTVTMVLLVVILLTVAITLRSFDRANTARNVRVNQQVLAAATPALDRAKAKIQFMLREDPQRPTATPSDAELYARIANALATEGTPDLYSFGDEERLIVKADLDNSGTADATNPTNPPIGPAPAFLENEAINTAWRYPVDTNNDGEFDTFTLYGIFFRTPSRSNSGNNVGDFTRARKPLEARTPPMSVKGLNPDCVQGGGTVASLVGDSGWYKIDGKLKKSFFVYTVNVPFKELDRPSLTPKENTKTYKEFTGTTSISALEYQQDQSRIPLANNAVVYEDDLDISPGPPLNLNGRIFTNSNLLVTGLNEANSIKLYQVSSQDSCFYEQENSKIVVGGNVVNGWAGSTVQRNAVDVHLFKKFPANRNQEMLDAAQFIDNTTEAESADNNSLQVLYNNEAYAARLSLLVAAQMGEPLTDTGLPEPEPQPSDPFSVQRKPATQTREQALREYFKQMLRKVPFAEVGPVGVGATQNPTGNYGLPWNPAPPNTSPITGAQDTLRPADNSWMLPDATTTGIELRANQLETTIPEADGAPPAEETFLGDRVVAGNNLPALRWDGTKFISTPETITGSKWNSAATAAPDRTHSPQVTKLADVGATERSGFWEGAAAETPKNPLDGVGGLRVITSAGVYERTNSFLPPPTWINPLDGNGTTLGNGATDAYDDPTTTDTEKYPVVWPDTMPMSPLGLGSQVYNNSAGGAYNAANWVPLPATAPVAPIPPGGTPPTGLPAAAVPTIDPTTPQYAKGDLRMRATAVYHYATGGYDPSVQPINLDNVRPIACVSSYYDPSTASTARNLSTLPALTDVSGDTALGVPGDQVGSNNGVVYSPPEVDRTQDAQTPAPGADGLLGGNAPNDLQKQANYVFPDGRFANEPLRKALLKEPGDRTLGDKAAIDSTMCALKILADPITPVSAIIPHGAIKEVAFLNAREIKAIDRDDWTTPNVNEAFTLSSPLTTIGTAQPAQLTGNYNLPLEEREPLEIRATQIDLDVLRKNSIAAEPLLPYSGIIYASRDDALPDRSARIRGAAGIDEGRSATVSPTDSLLDPTRKPNGILLVNGSQLARDPSLPPTVANVVREKGLTLASNLPVYIQGDFNLHTQREFGGDVSEPFDFGTFYDRAAADLNKNFACRPNDPRLNGNCTIGDNWRPANVLADAVTLLSNNYRFGFRNEGDFDLRNNAGATAVFPRKQQGFYTNNFVTNGLSSGAFSATGDIPANPTELVDTNYANTDALRSSYFNNFVTPVQRRGEFPEFVMEVCTKLPVSACEDGDWYVNPAAAPAGKATVDEDVTPAAYPAGTTAIPPAPELQRFPRRVAFSRTTTPPELDTPNAPVPLGITGGKVVAGPGETKANSLWFATTPTPGATTVSYGSDDLPYVFNPSRSDSTGAELPVLAASSGAPNLGSQPLLMPVLQIQNVGAATRSNTLPRSAEIVTTTGWMLQAQAPQTTFNLILGANDTPSRTLGPAVGDFNGGLQNLPQFLENWGFGAATTNIQGAFIQFNRSAYSTAPYIPILDPLSPQQTDENTALRSLFDQPPSSAPTPPAPASSFVDYSGGSPDPLYRTANASVGSDGGRIPFFAPPTRNWGFDVGLLSQPPDLFTQKFTTPPSRPNPDEYFREVGRDDDWVETLMCSKLAANNQNATSSRSNCPA
ncbi:hormogonium polysaccharide biosynthesis protein HpsA [Microcoleus sp. BROC3]|uniref:hormogonium polysaccharide biosynthesis protein HpsA n=1 Tax=Microcoleus sp. BROC3 TaxID=3055323 RepID=UPI002FD6E9F1